MWAECGPASHAREDVRLLRRELVLGQDARVTKARQLLQLRAEIQLRCRLRREPQWEPAAIPAATGGFKVGDVEHRTWVWANAVDRDG